MNAQQNVTHLALSWIATLLVPLAAQAEEPPATARRGPASLTVTEIEHHGQPCFRIASSENIYIFDKRGGGFASVIDRDGRDWISYRPGGRSAGEFRGLPNCGECFHPGYSNSASRLIEQAPDKVTIRSETNDGRFAATWDIFATHATMTLERAGGNYWFLYEGTPGGSLNEQDDFMVCSGSGRTALAETWSADLPGPEWLYFADGRLNRSLWLLHHEDDQIVDQYWPMEGNMTVFGFGRQYRTTQKHLTAAPARFSFGLCDSREQADVIKSIQAAVPTLKLTQDSASAAQDTALSEKQSADRFDRSAPTARMIDFIDPTYGGRVRQIFNPAGDEHDLYHYRSVFNADNSRLLGIETPHGSADYEVTLYDGDGLRLKKLFTQKQYDWTLAWDRRDPRYIYTRKNGTVYRYNVEAEQAEPLRLFENPTIAGPTGLSLNETGDRLLLRMTDQTVRTYRLPALDDERICRIETPDGWQANWDKLRFTGHKDFFALTFEPRRPPPAGVNQTQPLTRIYDGVSGSLFHTHDAVTVGHHDFSSSGKLAYVEGYFNQAPGMKVRVVNLDGTDNRVVFTAPRDKLRYVRNYHITWPAGVRDWFLLSFFPQTGRLPPDYEPYLDEIVQVFVDGRSKVLARTGTTCAANFWAQPQQSPSADGSRVLFHSNGTCRVGRIGYESSGTIDQCILYLK